MIPKLTTGVLLVAALLLECPAMGQNFKQMSAQAPSISTSEAMLDAKPAMRMDLPREFHPDVPVERGFSAAGFASALIELLASQNAIRLDGTDAGAMDAYLRPPRGDTRTSGLFRQAKSLYDQVTTIESENAQVEMDPLKMRCALRINLNRLLSN